MIEKDHEEHCTESGYAVITDLNTQALLAQIPIGKEPKDVAIDLGLNAAFICNKDDKSISIVDLASLAHLNTIPLGACDLISII